jgi:hypothetical protein
VTDRVNDPQWLQLIGEMLDRSQQKLVEARCEELRREFYATVGEAFVEQKRAALQRWQRAYEQAARETAPGQPKLVEARRKELRREFRAIIGDAFVEQKRAALQRRQRAYEQAARETAPGEDAPLQDSDWLPYAGGYLGPKQSLRWVPNLTSIVMGAGKASRV